jgi:hypothetical protein
MLEWYEFLYKEKYSGEVYLELTFYSNVRRAAVPYRSSGPAGCVETDQCRKGDGGSRRARDHEDRPLTL